MKKQVEHIAIQEIGGRGDGVGAYDGKPVYVAKTAPGDVVEALLESPRADGYAAKLQKIITPSPDRVEAPCPYFSACGSCSLQHVTKEFYHNWKIAKVQGALARANVKIGAWNEPIFLPAASRRRTSLTAVMARGRLLLGYNEARSHDIVDAKSCLILEPELETKMQGLRPFLPRILPEGKVCDITLQQAGGVLDVVMTGPLQQQKGRFTLDQDEGFGEMMDALKIARLSWQTKDFSPVEIILSRIPVLKRFGAITVTLPPAAFLQASDAGEEALVSIVLENTKGAAKIADLFSGCGTFAGHLLSAGASVHAVDGDPNAIGALGAVKHPRLTTQRRDLFKNPLMEADLKDFDTVVFDPPRAGAAAQAERLAWSSVQKIIGISCNPVSFARDAATLGEGGFKLKSLTLIDQFVYSPHVEVVGIFGK